jgi:hypothetical protein
LFGCWFRKQQKGKGQVPCKNDENLVHKELTTLVPFVENPPTTVGTEDESHRWIHFSVLDGVGGSPSSSSKTLHIAERAPTTYGFQIGINYILSKRALRGCINDALNLRSLLLANQVPESNLTLYSDFTSPKPTKRNVTSSLRKFLQATPDGANILISFSGHGTRYSLVHETLCLLSDNLTSVDLLLDDELWDLIVPIMNGKKGSRLFLIADSCFSENVMNLRHTYYPDSTMSKVLMKTNSQYRDTSATLIMISGSTMFQTSADVQTAQSIAHGALTWTLLRYLYENRVTPFSYTDFILGINKQLRANRFTQISCLSSSQPLQLSEEMRFP